MEESGLRPTLERIFGAKTFVCKLKDQDWIFFERGKAMQDKSLLEAALDYQKRGFSVIPMGATVISQNEIKKFCRLPSWAEFQKRRPSEEEIRRWWTQWTDAQIGVVCGAISNLIVIDTDTPMAVEEVESLLPDALEVPCHTTPRGGRHYFFQYREGVKSTNKNGIHQFEIHSDGTLAIIPPGQISDGRKYQWIGGRGFE